MAVKTITITEDAYRKLARLKRGNESFSAAINRPLGGPSALALDGLLALIPAGVVVGGGRRVRPHHSRAGAGGAPASAGHG